MSTKNSLALVSFAVLLAAPARAQRSVEGELRPVAPVVGPAFSGAAVLGLTAPRLTAPTLPSAPLTMPTLTPTLPTVAVAAPARAALLDAPRPAAAAPAAAPKREKPVLAGLETAAKPFADAQGRASADAGARLTRAFDNGILQAADEAAAAIPAEALPGIRPGAGLAPARNGATEERQAETPRPVRRLALKPETRGQRIATGVLVALLLAGSLFSWYTLYASMGQVFQLGEQQLQQSVDPRYGYPPGAPRDLGDVFR